MQTTYNTATSLMHYTHSFLLHIHKTSVLRCKRPATRHHRWCTTHILFFYISMHFTSFTDKFLAVSRLKDLQHFQDFKLRWQVFGRFTPTRFTRFQATKVIFTCQVFQKGLRFPLSKLPRSSLPATQPFPSCCLCFLPHYLRRQGCSAGA